MWKEEGNKNKRQPAPERSNSKFIFYTFFFSLFRIRVRSDDLGLSVSHDTYRQHIGSPRRSPLSLGPVPAAATSFFFVSFFLFGFPWEFVAWRIKLLLGRTLGAGRGPAILWSNMDLDTDCMSQVAWGGREKCLKRNFWS